MLYWTVLYWSTFGFLRESKSETNQEPWQCQYCFTRHCHLWPEDHWNGFQSPDDSEYNDSSFEDRHSGIPMGDRVCVAYHVTVAICKCARLS